MSIRTLTPNQDLLQSGVDYLDPILGLKHVKNNGVNVSAPLVGSGPTLTIGDAIILGNGNGALGNNTLTAFFNSTVFPGFATTTGLDIQGVQQWTFTNLGLGSEQILTGVAGEFGIAGVKPASTGVSTITFKNSTGSMDIGNPLFGGDGVDNVVSTVNLFNNGGFSNVIVGPGQGVPFFELFINDALFSGQSLTLNTKNLTGSLVEAPCSPFGGAGGMLYGIKIGGATGSSGYTNWTITNQGAQNESLALSENDSLAARSVTLSDTNGGTGGFALYGGSDGSWHDLTSLNAGAVTGQLFITGAELGNDFGFLNYLDGDGGNFTLTLGSHQNNFADLTGWDNSASGLFINGGNAGANGTEVDLKSFLVTSGTAFGSFSGVQIVGAAGDISGTVDWSLFPGANELQLKDTDGDGNTSLNGDLLVTNATNNFTLDFTGTDFNGNNVEVDAATGGAGSQVTFLFDGNTICGSDNGISNSDGVLTVTGYNTVAVQNFGDFHEFFGGGILAESNVGQPAPELLIAPGDDGDGGMMIGADDIDHASFSTAPALVGHATIQLVGGNLLHPTVGTIVIEGDGNYYLGVTDASSITDSGSGELQMRGPADPFSVGGISTGETGVTVSAAGSGSILQGSMGPVSLDFNSNNWSGAVGTDDITSGGGNSSIYAFSGGDGVHLGGSGGNTVFIGEFFTGHNAHGQAITDSTDAAYNGYWGVGGGGVAAGPTTISGNIDNGVVIQGFNIATSNDDVQINVSSWAGGGTGTGKLENTDDTGISNGNSVQVGAIGGNTGSAIGVGNVVDYQFGSGGIANAATLAADLSGAGAIQLANSFVVNHNFHILFAVDLAGGGVGVFDVDFLNGLSGTNTTAGRSIVASELFELHGTNVNLAGLAAHPGDITFLHQLA